MTRGSAAADARKLVFTHHPYRVALEERDAGKLWATLHPEVVFDTPVFDTPIKGRDRVLALFKVLATVFEQPFIVDELVGEDSRAVVFRVGVGGHPIDGVDYLELDEHGVVRKITVTMRPLSAVVALALSISQTEAPALLRGGTDSVPGSRYGTVRLGRDCSTDHIRAQGRPMTRPSSTYDLPDAAAGAARACFDNLRYEDHGAVTRIMLNGPQRRNALSMKLSDELVRALRMVRRSERAKVVIIQGAGGTFCAGDDITEMRDWGDAHQVMRRVRFYQETAGLLDEMDKITISAVEGYAVGGGLEITMACDFVVATESAKWGMPEVEIGITPGWGGTTRMTRLIGRRRTKEVNLLGALHTASRAVEWNLWNRVVADGELEGEVNWLVEVLLSKNQQAMRQLKFIINRGAEADLHTAHGFEELSAGLSGALNGGWQVDDADQGLGVTNFVDKGSLWQKRRAMARDFWVS